jgi:hypothetical protein
MVAERRRFPPPWDIEEANASCFIVKDNNGQALAYVYFESDAGRRTAANLLTRDEARRGRSKSRNFGQLAGGVPLSFPVLWGVWNSTIALARADAKKEVAVAGIVNELLARALAPRRRRRS